MRRSIVLALAATLALALPASAVEQQSTPLTQVDITPFIEISGVAALIDWDEGAQVIGGMAPVKNLTMTDGGVVTMNTNAEGYRFSVGITDLVGANTAYVITSNRHDTRLTSVVDVLPANLTFGAGITALNEWTNYGVAAGTLQPMWDCFGVCRTATPGPEKYVYDLKLNLSQNTLADAYDGSMTVRIESL